MHNYIYITKINVILYKSYIIHVFCFLCIKCYHDLIYIFMIINIQQGIPNKIIKIKYISLQANEFLHK